MLRDIKNIVQRIGKKIILSDGNLIYFLYFNYKRKKEI